MNKILVIATNMNAKNNYEMKIREITSINDIKIAKNICKTPLISQVHLYVCANVNKLNYEECGLNLNDEFAE